MRTPYLTLMILLAAGLALGGCEKSQQQPEAPTVAEADKSPAEPAPQPPAPPIFEDFEGKPQLSLFLRLGDYRPAPDDTEQMQYWATFSDHLKRISGVYTKAGTDDGQGLLLRSLEGVESSGFFSPLAVTPDTSYRVSFDISGELAQGEATGVGVIEFDEFLWIPEQYNQSLTEEHQTGLHMGVKIDAEELGMEWSHHEFTFTTTPRAGMVHLVFYREGASERTPVRIDNIRIEAHPPQGS